MTSEVYKTFCQRSTDDFAGCATHSFTPLSLFYGDLFAYDWACKEPEEAQMDSAKAMLEAAFKNGTGIDRIAFFLGKDAMTKGYTTVTRSMFKLGYPYKDWDEDQYTEHVEPLVRSGVEKELFKMPEDEMKYGPGGFSTSAYQVSDDRFATVGSIQVRFSVPYRNDFMMIQGDFVFAFISILIVYAYMYFHLRSFFMATTGMFQIMLSMPIAGLFYQGVFQVKFFQFLHVLSVFLVLGIGADDIFVFTDAWKKTAWMVQPSGPDGIYTHEELTKRIEIAYHRSSTAIGMTSFTTSMAFMSCSVSKVMPMRTNGWYAAICIVINFVAVATFTPTSIMIHHYLFAGKRCCCPNPFSAPPSVGPARPLICSGATADSDAVKCRSCGNTGADSFGNPCSCQESKQAEHGGTQPKSEANRVSELGKEQRFSAKGENIPEGTCASGAAMGVDLTSPKKPFVDRCIESYYVPAMVFKYSGIPILPLFLCLVLAGVAAQGAYFTAVVPEDHMEMDKFTYMRDAFFGVRTDDLEVMDLLWGISGLDRDGADPYRPLEQPGTPVFDGDFDLQQSEAQQAILTACRELRALLCDLPGCSGSRAHGGTFVLGVPGSMACPLEDFYEWKGVSPVMEDGFVEELSEFRRAAEPTTEQKKMAQADWRSQIGIIDGGVKYLAVRFRSAMPVREPLGTGGDVREFIYSFAKAQRSVAPASAAGPQVISRRFSNFDLSEELIAGLLSGCVIAFPIAFVVLLVSTGNIVLSIYAILNVASIVLCVLGWCKSAQGWDLGIGECVAGVIVIGYSVDYVVHLAHMYEEASRYGHQTREARATFAIENLGTTVFAGAMTTAGSGLAMLACFSTFFHKMAKLILMTIVYSFIFSLGGFMSMMYLIGPEGHCGDIKHMVRASAETAKACNAAQASRTSTQRSRTMDTE
eukprot:CAMPEP_0117615078 /NCGR_PEP_ID=MMETSP0784-20121206/84360_1 /TAXON_ID=39447 /ORGANISM="" /LENGTH=922 /DNA_ID=CAMNT_0005418815 /DNA_START=97 /DNA_END=2866 /DNA_ORIENTATION=-